MEDAEPILVPGYRLDRYELVTPIASGGMASVWLARLRGKRGFEKLFAIKTIKTELTDDSRFQEMFLDEARIASAIQHPNVAQILDLGEQDEILYIVMEWVDGDSLSRIRRLAQKKGVPLPMGLSLRVLADACSGLHAAHELRDREGKSLNVVHRDVSPHNILVSSAGSVKVIDFGVAKARDRRAGETATGIVKGKLRYMAPEQAQGHPVDRRADIWAVGVCLHELLTGEVPFDADSDVDVLRRLMSDEAPPRAGGAVPQAVDDLLARSLARDPDQRFETAAAMARAIQGAIEELGLPSTNEDIAEFLRANLLDLETRRRDAVAKALSTSQAREAGGSAEAAPPQAPAEPAKDDAALAPTVLSERKPAAQPVTMEETPKPPAQPVEEAQTVSYPKTKRSAAAKKKKKAAAAPAGESKVTPAPTAVAQEQAAPPPGGRRARWVVAMVAVAAFVWFGWPGGERLRAAISPPAPPRPAITAETPKPAQPIKPRDTPVVTAPPPVTASVAPAPPVADAGATPLDAGTAADAGKRRRTRKGAPAAAPGEPEGADDRPGDEPGPYD